MGILNIDEAVSLELLVPLIVQRLELRGLEERFSFHATLRQLVPLAVSYSFWTALGAVRPRAFASSFCGSSRLRNNE